MAGSSSQSFATKAVHVARDPKKQHGCVNNGIFQSSTLVFDTYEDFIFADRIYYNKEKLNVRQRTYGRNGTETIFDCEEAIAELYGANYAKMTSCGYSAILVALNAFCYAGAHVLMSDGVYGPTRSLLQKTLARYGVEYTFYHPTISIKELEDLIKPNTKVIYMESPSSLTFEVQDIASITKLAKKHSINTILDNTFFTSYYFKPFKYGVDVVVEACTKYFSGHSDIMAGVVVFNENFSNKIITSYREIGANTTAINAYYVLRGIRTLKVRLDAHKIAVDEVIEAIKSHKRVTNVLHPSQKTTPGHEFFKKQCTGYTSLFSIVLDKNYSHEVMSKFFNRFQYFAIGYSWGGYESLVIQFPDDLAKMRISSLIGSENTCVRVYIGLEDTKDLIQDLKTSLDLL